jgi:DNA-binding NtrC family response regulator
MNNKKRILIVDDEAMIRQLISDKLDRNGYETVSVPNPINAIQMIANDKGNYDLIITDYKMPEMSGLDFVIAVHGKFPKIPIIVVSGYGTNDEIRKFLKNGAYDFLSKPFALKDLLDSVNNLFEGKESKPAASSASVSNKNAEEKLNSVESRILSSRPNLIRVLKLIEELIDESVSRDQKQKLTQIQNLSKEVSSTLLEVSEYLRN